jgi:hypothetical protein
LQHAGAELSAHETITAEHETWGSIAQLAAEYETIAAAAQHDRWTTLIRTILTDEQAEDVIDSDAFGALTAELRRAEANHHDIETLLPRLIRARSLSNADDIAAVLHERVARATTRSAGSGRTHKTPRLIVGLIPEAAGRMTSDMRQALADRRDLIEACADVLLDQALHEGEEVDDSARRPAFGREDARDLGGVLPERSPPTVTAMPSPHQYRSVQYVRDGTTYTSAGVSAGIDLALALVEEDHGPDLTREVARALVVYLQRAGGQSQFSAPLQARRLVLQHCEAS